MLEVREGKEILQDKVLFVYLKQETINIEDRKSYGT